MRTRILAYLLFLVMTPAFAQGWQQFEASTTKKIEVRTAPGPYTVIGKIRANTQVIVGQCFFKGAWCEISSGDISGFADSTLLKVGEQTVQEKYTEYFQSLQDKSATSEKIFTSSMIWTEEDSYMQGSHDVSLSSLISVATSRNVDDTAKGGATVEDISARMQTIENKSLQPRITVIWDGSYIGLKTVDDYLKEVQTGIDVLKHDHFILTPPFLARSLSDPPSRQSSKIAGPTI